MVNGFTARNNWHVANNSNVASFSVQRSTDGENFTEIETEKHIILYQ